MPLFTYRATNDDNKEVRGSIDSPDELNARKSLEDLNLDVIEISEAHRIKPEAAASSPIPDAVMPTFAFEGKDGTGAVRRGTMQAQSKYEAFKRLRDDQKLFLTMLSPAGVLPQYKDAELDQWQRGVKTDAPKPFSVTPTPQPQPKVAPVAQKVATRPTIGFTNVTETPKKEAPAPVLKKTSGGYHSLTATLRLYAGWLLAWYGLFVAIGYYSVQRVLPWDIPFVQAFYLSPLIFSFIVAIFIFLLMSAVHKLMKGGLMTGIVFTVLGIGLFVGVKMLA